MFQCHLHATALTMHVVFRCLKKSAEYTIAVISCPQKKMKRLAFSECLIHNLCLLADLPEAEAAELENKLKVLNTIDQEVSG